MGVCSMSAGQPAVEYFLLAAAPGSAPSGGDVDRSNPAEWIMDLTARVRFHRAHPMRQPMRLLQG